MVTRQLTRRENLIVDLKRLFGIPPFESSHHRFDGFFLRTMEKEYGAPIDELKIEVEFGKILARWEKTRADFLEEAGG